MASDKPPASRPRLRAIAGGQDAEGADVADAATELAERPPSERTTEDSPTRGPLEQTLESTHTFSPSGALESELTARQRAIAALGAAGLKKFSKDAFRIDSEVDRGGMGRVLLAADQRLGRAVALKQLLPGGGTRQARFIREMLITARLQHPNIVPIYEAGRWEGHGLVYSMRKVDGQSLRERLQRTRGLDERLALLPNLIAAADAIAYAHSEGILHRDIKPANMILGDFGETIVIDWGLAKSIQDSDPLGSITDDKSAPVSQTEGDALIDADLTAFGAVVGTPRYMSPEQALGESVGTATDVYALGACLYELLAGRAPYADERSELVLDAVVESNPRPPDELVDDLPAELCAVTRVAMARDPQDRYTALELAEELRRYQAGALVGAHRYTLTEHLVRWLRRNRVAVSVGAIALVVLAVLGIMGTTRLVTEKRRTQDALDVALERNDELLIADAQRLADTNPLEALQRLDALSPSSERWDSARAIAAVAARRGIPIGVARLPEAAHSLHNVGGSLLAIGSRTAWRVAPATGDTVSIPLPDDSRVEREGRVIGYDGPVLVAVNLLDGTRKTLTELPPRPSLVATSHDERFVAYDDDRGVVIRDVTTGVEIVGDDRRASSMAFSPISRQLAAIVVDADGSHVASFLEPNKPRSSPLPPQPAGRTGVSWNPEGDVAYLRFGNGMVIGHQVGSTTLAMSRTKAVIAPIASHSGGIFAIATIDRQVIIHQRGAHRLRLEVRGVVHAIKFAPLGGSLGVAGGDGHLHHWSYLSNAAHSYPHPRPVVDIAFGGEDTIYTVATDRWIRRFHVARQETSVLEPINPFRQSQMIGTRTTALAGPTDVVGIQARALIHYETTSGARRVVAELPEESEAIRLLASWSGRWVAVASRQPAGRELRLWSPRAVATPPRLVPIKSEITALGFEGETLVTGHADGTLWSWDPATGSREPIAAGDGPAITAVATHQGRIALARAQDPDIILLAPSEEPVRLRGHVGDVHSLAFTSDGHKLASVSADLDLRLWSPATGEGERVGAHTSIPTLVRFSPDQQSIVSVSSGDVFLWDVASGLEQIVVSAPYDVSSARFSADSRGLLMSNNYVVFSSRDTVPREVGALREWITENIAASPASRP